MSLFRTKEFTKIANAVVRVSFKKKEKKKYNIGIELISSHGNITMIGTFSGWVCKNILSLMKLKDNKRAKFIFRWAKNICTCTQNISSLLQHLQKSLVAYWCSVYKIFHCYLNIKKASSTGMLSLILVALIIS